jgi:hypothetical protein
LPEAYERMPLVWDDVPEVRHKDAGTRWCWVAALQSVRDLSECCNQVPSTHLGREFGRSASSVRMQKQATSLLTTAAEGPFTSVVIIPEILWSEYKAKHISMPLRRLGFSRNRLSGRNRQPGRATSREYLVPYCCI